MASESPSAKLPHRPEAPNPIRYLDEVSQTDFAREYKKDTFDKLRIREGSRVLEVGFGTGEDALALARLAGSTGQVSAIDRNPTMVAEGLRRARREGLEVDFRLGDAHALDFDDESFDACRSDRVFQHLKDPVRALEELVRVTRPGGRILIGEPDFEGLVIDSTNSDVTRRIVNYTCDKAVRHGWIGRRLWGMFRRCGLDEVEVSGGVLVLRELEIANQIWGLERHAEQAHRAGVVSLEEMRSWLTELRDLDQEGLFFSAGLGFVVCGQRPSPTP